jgi:hypothetical protein
MKVGAIQLDAGSACGYQSSPLSAHVGATGSAPPRRSLIAHHRGHYRSSVVVSPAT